MQKLRQIILVFLNKSIDFKNNPFKLNFIDTTSSIKSPSTIEGGKYITIGKYSSIGKYSWVAGYDNYCGNIYTPKIVIGDSVSIGNFACITGINEIIIGNKCLISEHVYISDHQHGMDPSSDLRFAEQPLFSKGKVQIGEGCFIGYRVSILPGIELGEHCIVGSHSVVNKSFPPYSMIAGVPAKIIKKYSLELKDWIKV
jgi:lipopolysaccharide O-acetyltransferase